MTAISILENVIANLIASALLLGASVGLSLFVVTRLRARRLRALGVVASTPDRTLPILVSHLVVTKGGALLRDGTPSLHFEGSAVPLREVEAAARLEKRLRSTLMDLLPEAVRTQLVRVSPGFVRLGVSIAPAPLNDAAIKHVPRVVVIGGPEFNSATAYFLEKANIFRIVDEADCAKPCISIAMRDQPNRLDIITPDSTDYNLGLVQRSTSPDGQVVLLLTGVGSNGTLAAVDWFIQHWDTLHTTVGDTDFGVCLQCVKREINPDGFRQWSLRREFPEGLLTGHRFRRTDRRSVT